MLLRWPACATFSGTIGNTPNPTTGMIGIALAMPKVAMRVRLLDRWDVPHAKERTAGRLEQTTVLRPGCSRFSVPTFSSALEPDPNGPVVPARASYQGSCHSFRSRPATSKMGRASSEDVHSLEADSSAPSSSGMEQRSDRVRNSWQGPTSSSHGRGTELSGDNRSLSPSRSVHDEALRESGSGGLTPSSSRIQRRSWLETRRLSTGSIPFQWAAFTITRAFRTTRRWVLVWLVPTRSMERRSSLWRPSSSTMQRRTTSTSWFCFVHLGGNSFSMLLQRSWPSPGIRRTEGERLLRLVFVLEAPGLPLEKSLFQVLLPSMQGLSMLSGQDDFRT